MNGLSGLDQFTRDQRDLLIALPDHHTDFFIRWQICSRVARDRLRAAMTRGSSRSLAELLNISAAERQALDTLSRALDLGKFGERTTPAAKKADRG